MKIKKKTLAIAAAALVVIVGAVCAVVFLQGDQSEIALKENQSYVYAYISDITGNEITYSVLDESVVTAYLEQQEEAEEEAEEQEESDTTAGGAGEMPSADGAGEMSSAGGAPDMSGMSDDERPDMSEMSEGTPSTDGERPDMSEMSSTDGERPDMSEMSSADGERPDMGEMPSGGMPSGEDSTEAGMPSEGEMPSGDFGGGDRKSTETVTALIPVGVTVHTQSDTETTFQRLVAGDMIKMLVETTEDGEEVITEIWML